LRILHVVASDQRRGAEVFASDLVAALARAGVAQRVMLLRSVGGVQFVAPTVVLPGTLRVPGLRVSGRAVARLRAEARDWRPTVVQAHGGEPLKHCALALAALGAEARPVLVYRRIGAASRRARRGPARTVHAALVRRADRVVAVANALVGELLHLGIPPDRVTVVPRGVDPARLAPRAGREATRRALGIPADAPVSLSLGALSEEKDPLVQVEVAARLRELVPRAVHLMAGDGPLRPLVQRAVRRRGLSDTVRLLGSRADVGDLLAAADALLLTSRTEGLPGALVEAGMVGLPAVAVRVGGVAEVVADGVTGRLVEAGDLEGLARALAEVLGDPALRRRMGDAARRRCQAFTIEAVAGRYLALYAELAAGQGAGAALGGVREP
jgi:glycosyltransferase involved in cell wall biosynthesis